MGTAVSLTLPAGSGGVGTLTASLTGTLPGSVTFVASTRRLSGTPAATFTSASFTYTMTDDEGESESLTFTIVVADSFEISITVPAQAEPGETVDILSTISNPNNDTLTITWKATAGDIADDSDEDTTITIPGTANIIAVTCTVTSDANETATATAYLTIGDPAANIFTPAVRIEIEGVDVTDRRIPSSTGWRSANRLTIRSCLPSGAVASALTSTTKMGISTITTHRISSSIKGYLRTVGARRCL